MCSRWKSREKSQLASSRTVLPVQSGNSPSPAAGSQTKRFSISTRAMRRSTIRSRSRCASSGGVEIDFDLSLGFDGLVVDVSRVVVPLADGYGHARKESEG